MKFDIGAEFFEDRDRYFIQDNNLMEELKRKLWAELYRSMMEDSKISFTPAEIERVKYLISLIYEGCGNTSAINCLTSTGMDDQPIVIGTWKIPLDDVLGFALNHMSFYPLFREIRKDIRPEDYMGNRIPQYYPPVIEALFGRKSRFFNFLSIDDILDFLRLKCSLQVCNSVRGHFVELGGFDSKNRLFGYNDPAQKLAPEGNGFNRTMTIDEFTKTYYRWGNVYWPAEKEAA